MTVGYPLHWPDGWPRTPIHERRQKAPFTIHANKARKELADELRLLGATDVIISSNVPQRADGAPFAVRSRIDDPGVAVYFKLDGAPFVMARDGFARPEDNLRSIGLAIEAIRAVERHGGAYMMRRAFTGFQALPAPSTSRHWSDVLGVPRGAPHEVIETAFRLKAKGAHPDAGGSVEAMQELVRARDEALKERHA